MPKSTFGHHLIRLASLHAAVSLGACFAADFKQPAPLDPDVASASAEATESMAGIRIPEGWTIELYAAEPDVANVVAFDIDNRGRMFVCETFRQDRGVTDNRGHDDAWLLADLAAETVQDRIDYHKRLLGEAAVTYAQHDDRIRRLEDTDGDGRVDKVSILANGFNGIEEGTGAGVLARGDAIYYTCIPKLWKLVDQDDDGIADQRIALSDGYGVHVAFRGHDLHGMIVGPDGRLYFSIGDRGYHVTTAGGDVLADPQSGAVFRCEMDGSGLEVFATGLRNPQELAFNDYGDLFSVDNNSDSGDKARVVNILEGGDSGWRMHYQYLPDRGPFNRERIWEPFHNEQPAYIVPPITNFTDGPSGLAFYPGTGFGDQLKDKFLISDFRGGPANSGIRSFNLEADGAFYKFGEDSDPIWTVLATDIAFGPDGKLYVSDWVDGWVGLGKGRVYQISDAKEQGNPIVAEVQSLLASNWSEHDSAKLGQLLSHVDRRVRFESQWELAKRGDAETLLSIAGETESKTTTRLHAIWGAGQIARQNPDIADAIVQSVLNLAGDADAIVRSSVAKVLGDRGATATAGQLRDMLTDESDRVRYAAMIALGKLKDGEAIGEVVGILASNDNADPALRHAGVSYLASAISSKSIGELTTHPNESVRRAAVVALRRQKSGVLSKFLADASPLVVLEAARAIHDQPVPMALQSLASLIEKESADPQLTRRVLNANYRLGNAANAIALAQYAGRVSAPADMRIEALDMLANWEQPDPRDRVTCAYRASNARPRADAAAALTPQIDILMTSQDTVREKAIEVASGLGISKIAPMLTQRIADNKQRSANRATALKALARLAPATAVKLASEVPMNPPNELVQAALGVLAKLDATNSITKFVDATNSRSVEVRQLGWDILGNNAAPEAAAAIKAGVNGYLDGSIPADVQLNVLEAAQANKGALDDDLGKRLADHQSSLAENDPLAQWLTSLEGGDVARGGKLFFEKTELSCLRCHKVDRAGGEVGPNLTVIGKTRDRRYLLEAICTPDAKIAEGFETAVVANDSGQVFSGIVKSEDDDFIELIQNDGSQIQIPTEEIEARRKGKSSMPDDLTKHMTARDLRDLVAYLASLKVDPRAATDVE
ncbi:PVC-type heme-binding CxxCH protein [Rubripirellula reticaptiva]|uniref:Cytochrome c n=1 Tax=Rubripirellula reticaptiva TaxID=2528013 RepID=A0A5C6EKZ8_9BACT|nr:PVC-type heme-binding CxxCH protein [Rubripirellula reticaptiva]TWU49125.1 Cytochrome c [Rubripirellula reticaptiva]